jgi:hypothetical protein
MPHLRLRSDELGSICQQLGGIKQESSLQAQARTDNILKLSCFDALCDACADATNDVMK